jgi:hypothetical protein
MSLLRLIFYRVGQRTFVFKDLSQVSTVHPAATGLAADEVLGLVLGWVAAKASADVFAARQVDHCRSGAGNTISWPVCRSLTATLLLGFWLLMKVAAPIAVSMVSRQYWVLPSSRTSNLAPKQSALTHVLQSSSAFRSTAGAAGFLNFSQSGDRPDRS